MAELVTLLPPGRCVEQRLFFDAESGERGDCLKCCLATLLGLGYDDVPHFASMGDRWWIEMTNWLTSKGWRIGNSWYSVSDDDPTKLSGYTTGLWLAGVTSRRTRADGSHLSHMVVMHDNEIAWDPHPARADGHLGFESGELLIPVDPAMFVHVPMGWEIPVDELNDGDIMCGQLAENVRQLVHALPIEQIERHRVDHPIDRKLWTS